jgi:hypothetical protein
MKGVLRDASDPTHHDEAVMNGPSAHQKRINPSAREFWWAYDQSSTEFPLLAFCITRSAPDEHGSS